MRCPITLAALAALAGGACAQSVTLHFESDTPAVTTGGTAHWVVRASFTGYPDPTAYFGGFVGEFPASPSEFGESMNYVGLMGGDVSFHYGPPYEGAGFSYINVFNNALLGTDDQSNPIDIIEFDVVATVAVGSLVYDAIGTATVHPNDFFFAPPDEFLNTETNREFTVETDTLVIAEDVEPMPEVAVVLRADRTEAILGEVVTWTMAIEYTGWDEPDAYIVQIEGDLLADEPIVGLAAEPVSLIGGHATCVADGASLLDLLTGQPIGGPYDTANPLDLCTFEVLATALGQLHYDLAGRVVVRHPAYAGPYRVRTLAVTSDTVNVIWPGCSPVDLTEPWDVLDASDITRFVELFLAGDELVDFTAPAGVLDLADIVAFVDAFNAGCP